MKRREFLKTAGAGLAASTAVAAPAIAQSMPELKWRMPTSWPKSLETIYGAADIFAKAVGEAAVLGCGEDPARALELADPAQAQPLDLGRGLLFQPERLGRQRRDQLVLAAGRGDRAVRAEAGAPVVSQARRE